jgi:hypothetical protein
MDIEQLFEQALGEPAVERERLLARIKELIPENYRLDDANTAEAGVVMEIYEALYGVELQDPYED